LFVSSGLVQEMERDVEFCVVTRIWRGGDGSANEKERRKRMSSY